MKLGFADFPARALFCALGFYTESLFLLLIVSRYFRAKGESLHLRGMRKNMGWGQPKINQSQKFGAADMSWTYNSLSSCTPLSTSEELKDNSKNSCLSVTFGF